MQRAIAAVAFERQWSEAFHNYILEHRSESDDLVDADLVDLTTEERDIQAMEA